MEKVLVSACLLGQPVRYNGGDKRSEDQVLQRWIREGRVVGFCPEIAGGLSVPRLPAEIVDGAGGRKVLAGLSKVIDISGADVSAQFISGARQALECARSNGIRLAILKERSPSCGTALIYDGTFKSNEVSESGVTAALLQEAGIRVFSELQLTDAETYLAQLEVEPQA